MSLKVFYAIAFVFAICAIDLSCAASCTQPALPSGSTWVSSPNCPSGTTYEQTNPSRKHCHCYAKCGYICDPVTGVTTTTAKANCPQTCENGPIWFPPNRPGIRCRCQGYNGCKYYLCEATTTTETPTDPSV